MYLVTALILTTLSCGDPPAVLTIENAWVRPNVPPVNIAAAYLVIHNPIDQPNALIAAETPSATITEMHVMTTDGNVMKMRKIDQIPIPAKGTTTLQPGGNHLMLIDLKNDLDPGDVVELLLTFKNGQKQIVQAHVKNPANHSGH